MVTSAISRCSSRRRGSTPSSKTMRLPRTKQLYPSHHECHALSQILSSVACHDPGCTTPGLQDFPRHMWPRCVARKQQRRPRSQHQTSFCRALSPADGHKKQSSPSGNKMSGIVSAGVQDGAALISRPSQPAATLAAPSNRECVSFDCWQAQCGAYMPAEDNSTLLLLLYHAGMLGHGKTSE